MSHGTRSRPASASRRVTGRGAATGRWSSRSNRSHSSTSRVCPSASGRRKPPSLSSAGSSRVAGSGTGDRPGSVPGVEVGTVLDQWAGIVVHFGIVAHSPKQLARLARAAQTEPAGNERISWPPPDYAADDVLVVREPEQLRALGDDLRSKIVILLRDRASSTTELAQKLGLPRGTVGHHVKVLEKAGLVRVVRTRQVRAMTEKVYGRTARLFLFKSTDADGEDVRNVAAASLRRAAEEMLPIGDDGRTTFAVV